MSYRPQLRMPQMNLRMPQMNQESQIMMMQGNMDVGFDGKMLRKAMARKTVDYHPSVVKYLEVFTIDKLINLHTIFLKSQTNKRIVFGKSTTETTGSYNLIHCTLNC